MHKSGIIMVLLLWLAADVTVFFWMSFPSLFVKYRKYWLVFASASDDGVCGRSTGE